MQATQTLTHPLAVELLKAIPHITVGSKIKLSLSDNTIVGVNIHAPSVIRKDGFTRDFMKNWCTEHGFAFSDKYPDTTAMQVYF